MVAIDRQPPHDAFLDELSLLNGYRGEGADSAPSVPLQVDPRAIHQRGRRSYGLCLGRRVAFETVAELLEALAPLEAPVQMRHLLTLLDVPQGQDLEAVLVEIPF